MDRFAIVSLWDMLKIASDHFVGCTSNITLLADKLELEIKQCGRSYLILEDEPVSILIQSTRALADIEAQLVMPATRGALERIAGIQARIVRLAPNQNRIMAGDVRALYNFSGQLVSAFCDELRLRAVYALSSSHADFYAPSKPLFGEAVEAAFPSSSPEIAEAGKCRALGRWTAMVMHLMRALEPAILALQTEVGVTTPKEQWHQILVQIEAAMKAVNKRTHGAEDEQWFSEAAAHFRVIKNAWRNYAMHGRDLYDEERAVEIYDSVRAFMRHLSTRLKE